MATEAQINANRENAKKSTGPTTAEGKAKSSRNGIPRPPRTNQHLLDDDDPGVLMLLLQDLFSRFRPVGEGEEQLVLRIGLDQWRLQRAIPLEAGIFRDRFQDVAAKDKSGEKQYAKAKEWAEQDSKPTPPPPTPPAEGDLLARAFNADCAGPNSFSKLARYESHLERSIDRCLRQLKAYQAARNTPHPGDPEAGPEPDPEPSSVPPKTDDYETNPKNGGIGVRPASSADGGASASPSCPLQAPPKTENSETNPKNGVSTVMLAPSAIIRWPPHPSCLFFFTIHRFPGAPRRFLAVVGQALGRGALWAGALSPLPASEARPLAASRKPEAQGAAWEAAAAHGAAPQFQLQPPSHLAASVSIRYTRSLWIVSG